MHSRFRCPRGCEGTHYKVVTTNRVHGGEIEVCKLHEEPVEKVTKAMTNGHTKLVPQKKPPSGMVRRVAMPLMPALTR